MTDANDIYSDYFKLRDVGADFYRAYILPVYLRQVLPKDRKARILDVGCGFGQMLKALRAEGYLDLSGMDISGSAVESCIADGLDVAKVDSIVGFRPQERFDFIIMSHIIEHLEKKEVVETLRAVRQHLLREGGQLLIMTPNAQSHTGCYWAYEDFTHCTMFTSGSLSFVLRYAGFQHVEFLDPLGTAGSSVSGRLVKHALIFLYRKRLAFWNFITGSAFHGPSPDIFTFELKALVR